MLRYHSHLQGLLEASAVPAISPNLSLPEDSNAVLQCPPVFFRSSSLSRKDTASCIWQNFGAQYLDELQDSCFLSWWLVSSTLNVQHSKMLDNLYDCSQDCSSYRQIWWLVWQRLKRQSKTNMEFTPLLVWAAGSTSLQSGTPSAASPAWSEHAGRGLRESTNGQYFTKSLHSSAAICKIVYVSRKSEVHQGWVHACQVGSRDLKPAEKRTGEQCLSQDTVLSYNLRKARCCWTHRCWLLLVC